MTNYAFYNELAPFLYSTTAENLAVVSFVMGCWVRWFSVR